MTAVLHDTRSGFDPLTRPGKDFSSTPHRLGGATAAPPGATQPKGTGVRKVVADDYMYEFAYPVDLPTIDRYDVKLDSFQDPNQVATEWLRDFSSAMTSCDGSFAELFLPDGVWRDKIAVTWEYRTFNGRDRIAVAAKDLLPRTQAANFKLIDPAPKADMPYDDLKYVQAHFVFETAVAEASAVVNLIPTEKGVKAWTLHTAIEGLKQFPELPDRDGHMTGPLSWASQRKEDVAYDGKQPQVLIIGGGHNGLMMAARLQALGVSTLIIEKNKRIGDNWRNRYEALSLHFPHWADHLPYMPYPQHWPTYTPAAKLGDWLEYYAESLELRYWCSSSVVSAEQDKATGAWTVKVDRGGEGLRVMTPKHVVMATSLAGIPMIPTVPGMKDFNGTIRHSTSHDSSREWVGKKVLVVGTSSSGFDTAYDFARRDIDVTILQRSPTYIMSLTHSVPRIIGLYTPGTAGRPNLEVADRIAYSMPVGPGECLGRRLTKTLAELDKEMIDALEAKGFRTYSGQRETGVQTLGYTKNGGFYFDAGACEQIINGKIKVEQGSVERFTADKVILNGGRQREYDLVVFATGFSNTIDSVRATLGSDIASRCKPIWGMDKEGELNSAWRSTGVPNFWIMVGTLQHGRYHSKKTALRIKAMLEGIAPESYEA